MSSSDVRSGLNDLPDDFITISYEFTEEGELRTDVSAWVKSNTQQAPSNDRSTVEPTFKLARSKRVNYLDQSIQNGFAQLASDSTKSWEDVDSAIPGKLEEIVKSVDTRQGKVTGIRLTCPSEFQQFKGRGGYIDISRSLVLR
ncbi:hypothetical protein L486_06941 [Kwoniella mangroviensis CBS 10435]|uniref:Uncharacterized protein n=1 Tax=Kwoniella mangroviensis CBS 10435 TaxID=1331196 RepID=A0A1B9IIF8_9TREE|nr:uncharacterized protein I203_06963 [Kwoniella mangroviensis CBS 8507]OCF55458.1 hypothetical protein L486_06941 [Kwoniella mangroviensis CBS 10435]OCF64007.1 hypothetical protein I203_06963 [Kwoniella mangroviensis CBS 8507]OCF73813.1 hypothetical protein I204_05658 [Kwoniella mangroviensis CBS 8886]